MPPVYATRSALDLLISSVLFLLVLAIYWSVRHFNWINFDDPLYVFDNETVLHGLNQPTFRWAFLSSTGGLWQPTTMLSFLLDIRLWGPNPGPMHLENVLLHGCSAGVWYLLLVGMTHKRIASFFVAGLFAFHPAHVESVAWITERKDVLSMLLMVMSLFAYWRYTDRRSALAYIASLLLFSLALMSKAMVITQPVLMLLLDYWPLGRTRWCKPSAPLVPATTRRLLLEKLPFAILSIAVGAVAIRAQSLEGATPDLQNLSIYNRLATSTLGYLRYLATAFCPKNLAVFYPYQFNIPPTAVIAAAIMLAVITAVVFRFRIHRPYLLMGWTWFMITLLPVIGLTQAGNQSMADRFTYLPFIGLSLAVGWTVADAADKSRHTATKVFAIILGTIVLIACTIQTRRYLPFWSDTLSLFTKAAESNGQPDWVIEYHLALAYLDANQPEQAIEHYNQTLALNPNLVSAHINLANLLMRYSPSLALPHYETAVRLAPANRTAHYDYGICLQSLKCDAQAREEFQRAGAVAPNPEFRNPNPRMNSE